MDQILIGLGAAGAALLIIAVAVALWEHRRHEAEMRQQMAWSENTRELLQAHAKDVDARLSALTAAVQSQQAAAQVSGASSSQPQPAPPGAGSGAPVQDTGSAMARPQAHVGTAAVALAAAQAAVTQQWIDTEPMVLTSQVLEGPVLDFDPTMPAEFSEH
jgi:hypothetical protein